MAATTPYTPFRFLDLPGELRNNIYENLLGPGDARQDMGDGYTKYTYDLALFLVNKQIYHESRKIFKQLNVFARIETPWDEAQQHVAMEGNVPVLATGQDAENFANVHLRVIIDAPRYTELERDNRKFIVLADDLEAFTKMVRIRFFLFERSNRSFANPASQLVVLLGPQLCGRSKSTPPLNAVLAQSTLRNRTKRQCQDAKLDSRKASPPIRNGQKLA
jgi:hypothetical protein